MMSLFEDFELQPNGTEINYIQSFKYMGITKDAKWSWKPHISNLLKKCEIFLKWYYDQKIISFFSSDFESVFA